MSKEYSYGTCPYRIKDGKIQILLIQPKGHIEWGFAKGKIDENETKEQCAIRETQEEIGLYFNNLENYFEQKNKRKDIGIYLCSFKNKSLKNIKLQKGEVHRVKFFDLYSDIEIYKNQSGILEDIRTHFRR